jgi:LysR family glycine cleavage system transcriptional activator
MKYWKHVPPLRAMLAIEATARLGSFSKAAAELNVTQSAISHLVAETEAMLSTRLFERGSRPVLLTEAGRRYVAALVSGLNLIGAEGESLQRTRANVITVSCNLAYANFWLLPRLKQFHELRPDIVVNMVTAYQGLPELSSDIDLSIRFGKGDWEECEMRLLFNEAIVPVANPAYLERFDPIYQPADLLKQHLLHARADDRTWYDWEQWFDYFGVARPPKVPGPIYDNHLMMMQSALSGGGIALGWIGTASEFVQAGQLVEVLPRKVVAAGGVYLVHRSGRRLSSAAEAFSDWLSGTAAAVMPMARPVSPGRGHCA